MAFSQGGRANLTRQSILPDTGFLCLLSELLLPHALPPHSYARWWEARTQWGSNLATMRNYTRLLAQWCPPDKKYILHAARRWVPGEGQGRLDV